MAQNQRGEIRLSPIAVSLTNGGGKPGQGYPCVFVKAKRAQSVHDDESWKEGGVSPTLNAFDNAGESRATVIAFGHTQGLDIQPSEVNAPTLRREGGGADGCAPTLTAANDPSRSPQSSEVTQQVAAVYNAGMGVRRLTPRECERLMGWPDDHTRYTADGAEVADSARYRMCGNGVAAPVAKYVAECVDAILND